MKSYENFHLDYIFSTIILPTEYPAPKEQITPMSFLIKSLLCLWNAIIDTAELVLAYSLRTIGITPSKGSLPNHFFAIS